MATHYITVELSAESINQAIAELQALNQEIDIKTNEVIDRMADLGVQTAKSGYASAPENNSVSVTAMPIGNGKSVVASGADVLFNEFGAGVSAGAGHPWAGQAGAYPWSWSKTKGTGEGAKHGSWHHNKKKYTAIEPSRAMYNAYKEMLREFSRIAKDVFG